VDYKGESYLSEGSKGRRVVVERDGIVEDILIDDKRGMIVVTIRHNDGTQKRYDIKYGDYLLVSKGDRVQAMDKLVEGDISPLDILKIKGPNEATEYLLEQIQKVYSVSGVVIDDKHIEIILRQMMRRVKVIDGGTTRFLPEQIVDRVKLEEENAKVMREGGKPAKWEPIIVGVSKVASTTDSFLASASFEEAPRILAEAAIRKQEDELRGLKERVIIGDLIPAGTGFHLWRMDRIVLNVEEAEEMGKVAGA
jgi:RNA polymerase Rpb1, domain 5.